MRLKRANELCEKFERFWQESLDASRPRWDEYWFNVAWADHLESCAHCRERNQRYRKLAQALSLWNPDVGEVPDLSESSLRLWKQYRQPEFRLDRANESDPIAMPTQPPSGVGSRLKRAWTAWISRRNRRT